MKLKNNIKKLILLLSTSIIISCSSIGITQTSNYKDNISTESLGLEDSQPDNETMTNSSDQNLRNSKFHDGEVITPENVNSVTTIGQINIFSYDIIWSPDGDRLYLTEYSNLYVYSTSDLTEIKNIKTNGWISNLSLTKDGRMLAIESDESISVWDTETWNLLHTITSEHQFNDIAFSTDSRLLAASDSEDILTIWNLENEEIIQEIEYLNSEINIMAIEFSPNDNMIATGTQDSTRIWDTETWEEIYLAKNTFTGDLFFFPDNSKLAYIDWEEIKIINLSNFSEIKTLVPGDEGKVKSIALSPNGELLVSTDVFGNVVFWDAHDGNELFRIRPNSSAHKSTFSPDGTMLAFRGGEISNEMSGVIILGIP